MFSQSYVFWPLNIFSHPEAPIVSQLIPITYHKTHISPYLLFFYVISCHLMKVAQILYSISIPLHGMWAYLIASYKGFWWVIVILLHNTSFLVQIICRLAPTFLNPFSVLPKCSSSRTCITHKGLWVCPLTRIFLFVLSS